MRAGLKVIKQQLGKETRLQVLHYHAAKPISQLIPDSAAVPHAEIQRLHIWK